MKRTMIAAAALLALTPPIHAQEEPDGSPSPNQIVDAAPDSEWVSIAAEDLLVMTLTPDRDGNEREVVIQLMPAPFSQGWVGNIRKLARAKWYDGISVNRVQDNYVVQWGDANGEDPEKAKLLPEGLNVMGEDDYVTTNWDITDAWMKSKTPFELKALFAAGDEAIPRKVRDQLDPYLRADKYSQRQHFQLGWGFAQDGGVVHSKAWPVHCYGMVGVGRNYSPDTGSGAELYTVIGHAPRHLDRNIALVGRIVAGMEHLSSLPRGSGVLGFYTEEEADKRTPILSVRVASDLPDDAQPQFEYLSTESETFAKYAEARANRRDPFFIVPAGGADICNIPVPIREID